MAKYIATNGNKVVAFSLPGKPSKEYNLTDGKTYEMPETNTYVKGLIGQGYIKLSTETPKIEK